MDMQPLTVEVPAELMADLDRLARVLRMSRDELLRAALLFAVDHFGQLIEDSALNPAGFDGDT